MAGALREDWARIIHKTPYHAFVQILSNNGFHAVLLYRIAHWLVSHRIPVLPHLLTSLSLCLTSAEIFPGAEIGGGLVIKHPAGVVIGSGAVIGRRCTILQNSTVGEKLSDNKDHSYPVIGDDVTICAGAVIVGRVIVGNRSIIGANAVVIADVPPESMAIGVPARIVRQGNKTKSPRADAQIIKDNA